MAVVSQQSISVIYPAYNEMGNIERIVEQATSSLTPLCEDWEVIIVNDGSVDKTGEIIEGLARVNPRIKAVHHSANRGYGAALKSGILKAQKDLIFFSDSDLQFHIIELLLLLTWIEQYNIVIGYRQRRQDFYYRRINAFGWKILVRFLLGLKVKDIDCAFKLFRAYIFKAVKIDAVGAMVNTEILAQSLRMGFKVKEIPVNHFPRLNGKQTGAKISVILKAFKELFKFYFKLRSVSPLFVPFERRNKLEAMNLRNKWRSERRKNLLPINFKDRRRMVLLK